MVCSFACASEKRGLCSQDVRRLETPEIKYLSHRSLITLSSLGIEIEKGVSPSLVFINFISFSNEAAFMVGERTASDGRTRSTSSCTKSIKIEWQRTKRSWLTMA
jgi:hypothetical protein